MTRPLGLVTGGSAGIGRHLVEALAEAGYDVAFTYIGAEVEAEESAAAALTHGGRVLWVECDAGQKSAVDRFHTRAADWHGTAPSLLVNNAAIQTWSPLLDLREEDWDRTIHTNLKGCFLNTQAAARLMREARGGSIVNLGSGCNKHAFPSLVDYTASKGGIEQLTKSSAIELGQFGIRVNCVAPGAIATARTLKEAPDYEASWAPITPLGRVGTPEDVAHVVLFFAGNSSRFVTGQTLWVDGGAFSRAPWPY